MLAAFSIIATVFWAALLPQANAAEKPAGDAWLSQWPSAQEADRAIVGYYDRRAREAVDTLRRRHSPAQLIENAAAIRESLKAAYAMPQARCDGQARLVRETALDGYTVEVRRLKVLPGVYSVLRIYRPHGAAGRRPVLFYLPGHGDAAWHPGVQNRVLGFVKLGYLAATVDPYGQGELTDTPFYNEYHGCGAAAQLLAAGESLLGIIMASHAVELDYLLSRSDVDANRVALMGGSMGGTHSLWFAAIDPRFKAAVPISAAPLLDPNWNLRHHCLCDLAPGVYRVADGETVRGLIAPRPLAVIYPDLEAPITDEGARLINEGRLDFLDKAAKATHFLTERQTAESYPFAREVYGRHGAAQRFREVVLVGPHGDAQAYREFAYGWFAHFLLGREAATPLPEQVLAPIADQAKAKAALLAWPDGKRPDDFVGPTAYARNAVAGRIARLPLPPATADDAARHRAALKPQVTRLLGIARLPRNVRFEPQGDLDVEGTQASRFSIETEPGLRISMLVFRPDANARPNGQTHVLLAPRGVRTTACSSERKRLTAGGAWVVCPDLRGMGSTHATQAAYMGIADQSLCVGVLKLGETLAGWWTIDVLAVVDAARKIAGGPAHVTVHGRRETGLVAILAAGHCPDIDAVETDQLLASYDCAAGFGFPYVYGDSGGHNASLGGYGSMTPCIPGILAAADIPQLASLVGPRPLAIRNPLRADGKPLAAAELPKAFAWTRRCYDAANRPAALTVEAAQSDR